MKMNVGTVDRIARIAIGLTLLSLPFWLDAPWRWAGLIGVMPFMTGLTGRCPAYHLLGRSTCPTRKPE